MRLVLSIALCLTISACASRQGAVSRIVLPKQPHRIDVLREGAKRLDGVTYIDQPLRVRPESKPTIPADGGALLTPRSWRAVMYSIQEWPRWGDTVESIVNSHNEAATEKRSWWPWGSE